MIYTGFHAVEERVRRTLREKENAQNLKVYFSKPGPRIKKILALAKDCGIECISSDDKQLDSLVQKLPVQEREHRGIVLVCDGENHDGVSVEIEKWLSVEREKATVVILDGVTDPHNIGAVLRSCDQLGADLLIVPSHNTTSSIAENGIIARTSAGASAYVPLATVTNLSRTADLLKENGYWLYAADAAGENICETTFAKKSVIVMGSEGKGISRLLEEKCDKVISIPTCGKIDSLNVSVAAGIILYERLRTINSAQ